MTICVASTRIARLQMVSKNLEFPQKKCIRSCLGLDPKQQKHWIKEWQQMFSSFQTGLHHLISAICFFPSRDSYGTKWQVAGIF